MQKLCHYQSGSSRICSTIHGLISPQKLDGFLVIGTILLLLRGHMFSLICFRNARSSDMSIWYVIAIRKYKLNMLFGRLKVERNSRVQVLWRGVEKWRGGPNCREGWSPVEKAGVLRKGLEVCGEDWNSRERSGVLCWGLKFCGEGWRSVERAGVLWRGLEVCGEDWSSAERAGGLWRGPEFCREDAGQYWKREVRDK